LIEKKGRKGDAIPSSGNLRYRILGCAQAIRSAKKERELPSRFFAAFRVPPVRKGWKGDGKP